MHTLTGFILHVRPFRENSAILEWLCLEQGRVSCLYRGKGKPRLQTILFVRYMFACRGRGELPTLTVFEEQDTFILHRERLWCGLYLNELALKLLPQHAPVGNFFTLYAHTVSALADTTCELEVSLRYYELGLLCVLGSGLEFVDAYALCPDTYYLFVPEHGLCAVSADYAQHHRHCICGESLTALLTRNIVHPEQRLQAKHFLRYLIAHYLDGKPITTRQLFIVRHDT